MAMFSSDLRTVTVTNSDNTYFYIGAGKVIFIPRLGKKHENNFSLIIISKTPQERIIFNLFFLKNR